MERKQASSPQNQLLSLIFPTFFSVFFVLLTIIWLDEHPVLIWGLILGSPISMIFLTWKYRKSYNVFFDRNFIYFQNSLNKIQVPLFELQIEQNLSTNTRLLGFNYQLYKLIFRNKEGALNQVNCWVSSSNDTLVVLENHLKR